MDFDVYCDESRPDVFCSHQSDARHLVIGSLWLPTAAREEMKQAIHGLRDKHRVGGEFKWRKVTPSRRDFYMELIAWYMAMGERLRFRCIAVGHSQLDLKLYHNDDQELGFYKFYYQMLHHWILDFNRYSIFGSRDGVKDQFSPRRAERVDWIKAALQDGQADLFVGWDSKKRRYDYGRRVTLVMRNYVVVIRLTGPQKARFVTAFVADSQRTLNRIQGSPRWTPPGAQKNR